MIANAESRKTRTQPCSKKSERKGALLLLTLLFIIIAPWAYGIYWFLVLLSHVKRPWDDAHEAGNQSTIIMAQVAGSVTKSLG